MALNTKLNLNDGKVSQQQNDTLSLSGNTRFGKIQYITGMTGGYNSKTITDVSFVTGLTTTLQNEILALSAQTNGVETVSRTIYITTGGSDSSGDGSIGNPYASFLKAIQSIKPIINDSIIITIDVGSGTYTVDFNAIQEHYRNLVFLPNSGLIVSGKYRNVVTGITMTSSGGTIPFVYKINGATFTPNEHNGRWLYASASSFYPIAYNTTTNVNTTVYATGGIAIVENTVNFNVTGSGYIKLNTDYPSNNSNSLEFDNINFSYGGSISILSNNYIDIKWCKFTATSVAINKECVRVNLWGCYLYLSSTGLNYGCRQFQLRRTVIVKSGTLGGVGITAPSNEVTIGLLTDGGVYLYNFSTGLQIRDSVVPARTGTAAFVFDNCTSAIAFSNNVNIYISNPCYVYNTVTNLLNNYETLVGNYHVDILSYFGTPTNLLSAGALVNGYVNISKNSTINLPGIYSEYLGKTSATLANNSSGSIQVGDITQNKSVFIKYTITRSTSVEQGTIIFDSVSDTNISIVSEFDDCGVTFGKQISGNAMNLTWATTNTGSAATFSYVIERIMV